MLAIFFFFFGGGGGGGGYPHDHLAWEEFRLCKGEVLPFTFQRTHQHKKPKSIASRFTIYLIKRRKYFKYMAIYMNLTPRHGAENALGPNLESNYFHKRKYSVIFLFPSSVSAT